MKKAFVAVALFALSATIPMRADQSKNEVQSRLDAATATLHELSATPDKGIPDEVYKSAKCIAVVPHLVKGAFIFGGEHGRGVATCRLPTESGARRDSSPSAAEAGDCRLEPKISIW